MKLRFLQPWIVLVCFVIAGCKKEPIRPSEKADFTRYIAIGNSITAGYSNGGLYLDGQKVAYPNIVAEQMKLIGGGPFTSPLFSTDQANGSGYLRLAGFNADGSPNIVPVTDHLAIRGQATITGFGDVTLYTKYKGKLNNYGVPGIKLQQITYAPLGNLNPYFERLLPLDAGENSTTYLDFVTQEPFTFFSCWLGNNDALGFATSGGIDSLIPKADFAALYNLAITNFTKSGAKGVVATIPDVTVFPFFNTVTVKALVDCIKKTNPALSAIYIMALNPVSGIYVPRAATENDLVLLNFKTATLGTMVNGIPGYGLSPLNPLLSKEVLDVAEIAKEKEYLLNYNSTVKAVASIFKLAVFDSYEYLNKITAGLVIDGVPVNGAFITGGIFSLDGVHLTPRGNAIAANQFIAAINDTYHSNLAPVNVSMYPGIIP